MNTLTELHQDHIHLDRLLSVLMQRIESLRAGGAPDFPLVSEIAEYIEHYVKKHHHPREDRMYALFKERNGELDAVIAQCEQAHQMLEREGQGLLEIIEGARNDAVMPMDELVARLEGFVSDEKAHLDFEESEVFPRIRAVAVAADWAVLAETLPARPDPLFGPDRAATYERLYAELEGMAGSGS